MNNNEELLSDDNGAITHFRTKTVGFLAFLTLSKVDAGSLLAALEQIDSSFSQYIDVRKFSHFFGGDYQETLLVLWVRYSAVIYGKKSFFYSLDISDQVVEMEEEDKNNDQSIRNEDDIEENNESDDKIHNDGDSLQQSSSPTKTMLAEQIFTTTYSQFLMFLIFFMSENNQEYICWLYWICFSLPKLVPTPANLILLIELLWGAGEKLRYNRNALKRKASSIILGLDPNQLTAEAIRMADLRSGGAWSTPLIKLKTTIASKIMGSSFWRRVAHKFHSVSRDWNGSYLAICMDKEGSRSGVNGRADVIQIIRGDSKASRKEIRRFIRAHQNYQSVKKSEFGGNEMTGNHKEKEKEGRESDVGFSEKNAGQSFFDFLRTLLGGGNASSSATDDAGSEQNDDVKVSAVSKAVLFKQRLKQRQKEEAEKLANKKEIKYIPLEVLYKEALLLPYTEVHERSTQAIASATDLLEACSDESLLAIRLPRGGLASSSDLSDESEEEKVDEDGEEDQQEGLEPEEFPSSGSYGDGHSLFGDEASDENVGFLEPQQPSSNHEN